MTLSAKLLTELVGTFVFFIVIALSGHAGALAPLAIGVALMAMVYMGGHVSGAHYNPAVSFGLFARGVISASTMAAYWAAQLVAGILAFAFGYLVGGGHRASNQAPASTGTPLWPPRSSSQRPWCWSC